MFIVKKSIVVSFNGLGVMQIEKEEIEGETRFSIAFSTLDGKECFAFDDYRDEDEAWDDLMRIADALAEGKTFINITKTQ